MSLRHQNVLTEFLSTKAQTSSSGISFVLVCFISVAAAGVSFVPLVIRQLGSLSFPLVLCWIAADVDIVVVLCWSQVLIILQDYLSFLSTRLAEFGLLLAIVRSTRSLSLSPL